MAGSLGSCAIVSANTGILLQAADHHNLCGGTSTEVCSLGVPYTVVSEIINAQCDLISVDRNDKKMMEMDNLFNTFRM
jgi:hypothetical protein